MQDEEESSIDFSSTSASTHGSEGRWIQLLSHMLLSHTGLTLPWQVDPRLSVRLLEGWKKNLTRPRDLMIDGEQRGRGRADEE